MMINLIYLHIIQLQHEKVDQTFKQINIYILLQFCIFSFFELNERYHHKYLDAYVGIKMCYEFQ